MSFQKSFFFNFELEPVDHLLCTYYAIMPSMDWPLKLERHDGFDVIL